MCILKYRILQVVFSIWKPLGVASEIQVSSKPFEEKCRKTKKPELMLVNILLGIFCLKVSYCV